MESRFNWNEIKTGITKTMDTRREAMIKEEIFLLKENGRKEGRKE